MSLQDVYDMSWAEFILRSIAFKEEREFQMLMTRVGAYQTYCSSFVFGKKKPVTIDKFWPIGGVNKSKVTSSQEEAFRQAHLKYLDQVKKNQNG